MVPTFIFRGMHHLSLLSASATSCGDRIIETGEPQLDRLSQFRHLNILLGGHYFPEFCGENIFAIALPMDLKEDGPGYCSPRS